MPTPDDPLATFRPWSLAHWAAIVAAMGLAALLASLRRLSRKRPAEAGRLDARLAAFAALTWLATQLLQARTGAFDARNALPLHVSDLTALAVPLALWTCWRWVRCVVYYWGLALASLAFVLPDLRDGPGRLGYWLFWVAHAVILLGVAYETIGRGYRPGWRDFRLAVGVSMAYATVMIPFNAATGYTYGYLGPPHAAEPAALAFFGPWPLRVVPIILAGVAAMALLTVPWKARSAGGRAATAAVSSATREALDG